MLTNFARAVLQFICQLLHLSEPVIHVNMLSMKTTNISTSNFFENVVGNYVCDFFLLSCILISIKLPYYFP